MGGEPYFYLVPYQPDIDQALQALRRQEFQAGRYNPVLRHLDFPIGPDAPAPGPRHRSIEEALHAADADGTRSILDMERVGDAPDYGVVTPVSPDELLDLFGTTEPTRAMLEAEGGALFDLIDRGQGIYVVVYEGGNPSEIYFAGYSYD